MVNRDFDRRRSGQMDWYDEDNGYRRQYGRDSQFGSQSGYGGWGGRGGQGEYGGEGYGGSWQSRGGYGGQYGQDYEEGYGGPGRGRPQWQQGGYGYGDEGEFGTWRGGEGFGREEMSGWRGGQHEYGQPWSGQGRSWDQGQHRRGTWGQGPGRGERFWGRGRSDWDQGFASHSYGGQRFGGQGFGSQGYGEQDLQEQGFGHQGFGGQRGWQPGFGSQSVPSQSFVYEELWFIPGPYSGRGPRGYQRSDQRIEEDICERLTHHGQLDASDIQVQVKNGEVTLTGTVESRQAKRLAEDLLDSVSGVKDVHNQLRVQQPSQGEEMQGPSGAMGQTGKMQGQTQTRNQAQKNEKATIGAGTS